MPHVVGWLLPAGSHRRGQQGRQARHVPARAGVVVGEDARIPGGDQVRVVVGVVEARPVQVAQQLGDAVAAIPR
jgi:hypothetical protein